MKILIIDSHKGTGDEKPQNLHWQNAKILADVLQADFIWSYPTVNDEIKSDYDAIIFVHASQYAYIDINWIEQSPNARLFYITNEYNLGEPIMLWKTVKAGRKYTVIANHPPAPSKIVMKYVGDWVIMNLNALVYNPKPFVKPDVLFDEERAGCVYYGGFRSDRQPYFKKYLNDKVTLSTHFKNEEKFRAIGVTSTIVDRIDWRGRGLHYYQNSLYLEDVVTHTHYNHLANRFYEALSYDCVPIFTEECQNTMDKSGYNISKDFIISSPDEIPNKINLTIPDGWCIKAGEEKKTVLEKMIKLIKSS